MGFSLPKPEITWTPVANCETGEVFAETYCQTRPMTFSNQLLVGNPIYIASTGRAEDPHYVRVFGNGINPNPAEDFAANIFASSISVSNRDCDMIAMWYTRWTNDSLGDEMHIVYVDNNTDDIFYSKFDFDGTTNTPTPSPDDTVILAGASTATTSGTHLSICVSESGYIYVAYNLDGGTEVGTLRSTNGGTSWGTVTGLTISESGGDDEVLLAPAYSADGNDIMAFYHDHSANEISYKMWDNSAASTSETSIQTSVVERAATTNAGFPQMSLVSDPVNQKNYLAFWTAHDTAGQDLEFYVYEDGVGATNLSAILSNEGTNQGGITLTYSEREDRWYAIYVGDSDNASEYDTTQNSMDIRYKTSDDGGVTWSAEQTLYDFVTADDLEFHDITSVPYLDDHQFFDIVPVFVMAEPSNQLGNGFWLKLMRKEVGTIAMAR